MSDHINHELSDTYRALKRFENPDCVGDTIVVKQPTGTEIEARNRADSEAFARISALIVDQIVMEFRAATGKPEGTREEYFEFFRQQARL